MLRTYLLIPDINRITMEQPLRLLDTYVCMLQNHMKNKMPCMFPSKAALPSLGPCKPKSESRIPPI